MPATAQDALALYRRRRAFSTTSEPEGSIHPEPSDGDPVFVVQIHDARSMHFDFRLEADGVLKSWAVPRGPSGNPHDKRLASPPKTIRWSTGPSRASSPKASTAPAR